MDPKTCRYCDEPLPLLRTFGAHDETLCPECDEEQFERDRKAALEAHLEDVAEMWAQDIKEWGR